MLIGIDQSNGLVYESPTSPDYGGRLIWPTPVLTPASFSIDGKGFNPPRSANVEDVVYWFREDHFDPVTRLRRGRLYRLPKDESLNPVWRNPTRQTLFSSSEGITEVQMYSYRHEAIRLPAFEYDRSAICLGVDGTSSIWSVISIEVVSTREEMLTLKARQTMGDLPEVNWDSVPESFRAKVKETIDTLLDDIHRAGPESVIDRCRDAASAILRAYLGDDHAGKDLGQLISALKQAESEERKRIVISGSEIIRVLHPRAKPNEQEARNFRPVREQDAELAIQCVGTILCELGWA